MPLKEYKPGQAFSGSIGRTFDVSKPAWPAPKRAKEGAPNVLFIVLDDTGFGHLGCYGGLINTPNLDKLAADGLRYNNMHTTALCSPSRSCMITGRNHHSTSFAGITECATGYDGYCCILPRDCGTVGEVLRQNGYMTAWIGKNHNTPTWETSAAGPFDRPPRRRAVAGSCMKSGATLTPALSLGEGEGSREGKGSESLSPLGRGQGEGDPPRSERAGW